MEYIIGVILVVLILLFIGSLSLGIKAKLPNTKIQNIKFQNASGFADVLSCDDHPRAFWNPVRQQCMCVLGFIGEFCDIPTGPLASG
jgi:hypothetical protein